MKRARILALLNSNLKNTTNKVSQLGVVYNTNTTTNVPNAKITPGAGLILPAGTYCIFATATYPEINIKTTTLLNGISQESFSPTGYTTKSAISDAMKYDKDTFVSVNLYHLAGHDISNVYSMITAIRIV
ncbi:hypothetical protein AALB16_07860 [Lachnospiraceae bacterium 62-35]